MLEKLDEADEEVEVEPGDEESGIGTDVGVSRLDPPVVEASARLDA